MEYTVTSSHGVLTIDEDGYVIECQRINNKPDEGGHLASIRRFDLVEWRRFWSDPDQTEIDILDLGYWYHDPETSRMVYVEPDSDWRREIAEILLMRKKADCVRAAAPRLLDAVKHVLRASEDCGDMNDIDWPELRAAVAEATGVPNPVSDRQCV